ncbi:MAG: ABC transporter permease [Gammaproteobacteria bacterium]
MNFVMLWTDYFVWTLVLLAFISFVQMLRNPLSRQTILELLRSRINVVAIIVLSAYILIGLLDSIHFKYDTPNVESLNEINSVLDSILKPMRLHSERSYSAPFATHAFTKETVYLPDGSHTRDYPRLQYGGAHLEDPTTRTSDVLQKLAWSSMVSLILWGALCVVLAFFIRSRWTTSWKTAVITFGVGIWLVMQVYSFMPYYHILGTSQVGEDVLYQGLKSIRTGLILGTVTTLVMLPFALILGLMAGYFKGWVDDAIQYLYTTLSSIPGVLLIVAAVLSLQVIMNRNESMFQTIVERSDARLLALCMILGITSWTGLCRLLRGEALKLSDIEYVQAARSLGVSHAGILFRHLLPNVLHIVLIAIVLDFSGLVLAEAVLSYVGVGIDPTSYSWGMMINSARLEMARAPIVWWSLATAFGLMFLLVLFANIFADHLRDALDPRIQKKVSV